MPAGEYEYGRPKHSGPNPSWIHEVEPIVDVVPILPKIEHVHEWTEYPSGKRKCKPCGAVMRPERNE